jgi:type III secretion protein I
MIETTIGTTLLAATTDTQADTAAGGAAPGDAARFQAMLDPLEPVPVQPGMAPLPIESPATLGDRILVGIDQMRGEYREKVGRMAENLEAARIEDGGQMQVHHLMQLQMDLMRVMFQEDLLGKIVGRTTQNVDSLLKGQ